jgi:hypothetical protein
MSLVDDLLLAHAGFICSLSTKQYETTTTADV